MLLNVESYTRKSANLALFPMPSGQFTRVVNVSNAQSRGVAYRHPMLIWYISLVMPTPVPKIKMARATSSILWLCLRLLQPIMLPGICPPNGSKP